MRDERAIVPVPGLTRAVVRAVNVARSIANRFHGIDAEPHHEGAATDT
jgi:hypothetical protein